MLYCVLMTHVWGAKRGGDSGLGREREREGRGESVARDCQGVLGNQLRYSSNETSVLFI